MVSLGLQHMNLGLGVNSDHNMAQGHKGQNHIHIVVSHFLRWWEPIAPSHLYTQNSASSDFTAGRLGRLPPSSVLCDLFPRATWRLQSFFGFIAGHGTSPSHAWKGGEHEWVEVETICLDTSTWRAWMKWCDLRGRLRTGRKLWRSVPWGL